MTQEILAAGGGELMEEQSQLEAGKGVLIFDGESHAVDSRDMSSVVTAIFHLTGLSVGYDDEGRLCVNGSLVCDEAIETTADAFVSVTNEFICRIGWMRT